MNFRIKYGIWFRLFFTVCIILCFGLGQASSSHREFNVSTFYSTLELENLADIDYQLAIIKEISCNDKEAYEGALLMKKAGLIRKPKDRISLFKVGNQKLESAISKNNGNTEYRFLRLIIQEHAPKIVKYNSEIEEDCIIIRSNFKSLSPILQQIVFSYSKKSTVLKLS
jgi:hypothetical protein